jgi:solute carrier family 25 (mitochondrial carnitine/acylcarnitine transporter), member 20/29
MWLKRLLIVALQYELVTRTFRQRDSGYGLINHASLAEEVEGELATVPWWATLLAGGLAGVASWLSTFPLDVMKTRMQSTSRRDTAYRSTLSTLAHCYREGGPRVLFAGLTPTLVRAVPVNMVTFATFEAAVSMMTG